MLDGVPNWQSFNDTVAPWMNLHAEAPGIGDPQAIQNTPLDLPGLVEGLQDVFGCVPDILDAFVDVEEAKTVLGIRTSAA